MIKKREKVGKFQYKVVTLIALIIIGFTAELFIASSIKIPPFPTNFLILILFILISISPYLFKGPRKYIRWITDLDFVLLSVSFLGLLLIIAGFVPQDLTQLPYWSQRIGFGHITRGIPFAILLLVICQSLLYGIIQKLKRFTTSNLIFVMNHLSILIIFLVGTLGTGDLKRYKMDLRQDKTINIAYENDPNKKDIKMPFSLKLNQFLLEEYPAKLVIMDQSNQKIIHLCPQINESIFEEYCNFKDWKFKIAKYLKNGFWVKDKFVGVLHRGTAPAIKVKAVNLNSNQIHEGWVSTGSIFFSSKSLKLNDQISIAMPNPRPKEYRSKISFLTSQNERGDFDLVVNTPFNFKGWKIYQYGYDQNMGKWSTSSIVELVKDPWLPIVYFGIFMLFIGTTLMVLSRYNPLEESK